MQGQTHRVAWNKHYKGAASYAVHFDTKHESSPCCFLPAVFMNTSRCRLGGRKRMLHHAHRPLAANALLVTTACLILHILLGVQHSRHKYGSALHALQGESARKTGQPPIKVRPTTVCGHVRDFASARVSILYSPSHPSLSDGVLYGSRQYHVHQPHSRPPSPFLLSIAPPARRTTLAARAESVQSLTYLQGGHRPRP